ncbi:20600_t:CDS:2 [Cetraspora pellucida]|uniref:20600_t:CDS:1 n=1 Tax=Cetraspora pellucida TaxID=1433469 RepID=A0A9N9HXT3_9GLOM|nr:20600_t:CDS:2 [Cetraspora pellucida]
MTEHQSNKAKIFADSYKLLLELVENLIPIQKNFDIEGNPVLAVEYQKLGIVSYFNKEIAEEADKNTKIYLQKFKKFYNFLENISSILI